MFKKKEMHCVWLPSFAGWKCSVDENWLYQASENRNGNWKKHKEIVFL